jgi:hypothetical protein
VGVTESCVNVTVPGTPSEVFSQQLSINADHAAAVRDAVSPVLLLVSASSCDFTTKTAYLRGASGCGAAPLLPDLPLLRRSSHPNHRPRPQTTAQPFSTASRCSPPRWATRRRAYCSARRRRWPARRQS